MRTGTVLAVELRADDGHLGYTSGAAKQVVQRMRPRGIFARPLGNVVYLMCTPTTAKQKCDELMGTLVDCL